MKKLLIIPLIFIGSIAHSQIDSIVAHMGVIGYQGFLVVPGIEWVQEKDSITQIVVIGDTATAIRDLLTFSIQQNDESMYASMLLNYINLDYIKKVLKDKTFNSLLAQYRKVVEDNQIKRQNSQTLYK